MRTVKNVVAITGFEGKGERIYTSLLHQFTPPTVISNGLTSVDNGESMMDRYGLVAAPVPFYLLVLPHLRQPSVNLLF